MLKKIAVLMETPFAPNTHCALSTWTEQVYSLLAPTIEVSVYSSPPSPPQTEFQVVIVERSKLLSILWRCIQNRRFFGTLDPIKRWLSLRRVAEWPSAFECRDYDMVHIHNSVILAIAVRRRCPHQLIVLHMNNDHLTEVDPAIGREAVLSADLVVFCSDYIRERARRSLMAPSLGQAAVIYNGAATAPVVSPNQRLSATVLYVGRITHFKGVHILVDAFEHVHNRWPNAKLKVIGPVAQDAKSREYLDRLTKASASSGDAVEFLGAVSHTEALWHIARATVLVCPSLWDEPLGMVNAEAMAAGTPVIAFANGGIPEVVGKAGILIREGSVTTLARAITDLIGDPARQAELGRMASDRIRQKFSWDVIAQQWELMIAEISENSG